MHVRQAVRNAITEIIKTIPEFTDGNDLNVFESRVHTLDKERMPAALVFSESEIIEQLTHQHNRIQRRHIETVIYVFARSDFEVENAIDPLTLKIENAILGDQTLGEIAENTLLQDTSLLVGADPDAPIGAARMSFISTVLTQQGDAETPLQNQGGIFS